tara:strand:+ start:324 stop:698 length:375 start_codon:yes stop_codon:yes gene_type:complete
MCKKNFEGKILSPPPSDDIEDEIIINDEIEDEIIKPKKRSRKARKARKARKNKYLTKICKTCGQDILSNEKRDMFMFHDTYHQLQTKDYCEDHERVYSDHKCKPNWCGDCGYLVNYQIEIQKGK